VTLQPTTQVGSTLPYIYSHTLINQTKAMNSHAGIYLVDDEK
jgi:hypothetical protein